jgi:hypothetical protein
MQVRLQVLKWLTRIFDTPKHESAFRGLDAGLCDSIMCCVEDGVLDVREV